MNFAKLKQTPDTFLLYLCIYKEKAMNKILISVVTLSLCCVVMAQSDIYTHVNNIDYGSTEHGGPYRYQNMLQQSKDSCEEIENNDSVIDVHDRAAVPVCQPMSQLLQNSDNAKTMYYIGYRYFNGIGVTQDKAKGIQWFKRSAEKGSVKSIEWLADYYECYVTGNKNKKRAAMLRSAAIEAKKGNKTKSRELIDEVFYLINLYERADNENDSNAMYKIAQYYENQERTLRTDTFTALFYVRAYKNGILEASTKIGQCFEEGRYFQQSDSMAVRYYRKGAAIGDSEALIRLAHCYEQGRGVEKDETKAYIYYTDVLETCTQDKLEMLLPRLANCYHNGIGVDKDEEIAGLLDSAYNHLVNGEETEAMNLVEKAKDKIFIDYTEYIKYLVWVVVLMLIIKGFISLSGIKKHIKLINQ